MKFEGHLEGNIEVIFGLVEVILGYEGIFYFLGLQVRGQQFLFRRDFRAKLF